MELTPEPILGMSATNRVVLRSTGRVLDAVAATRAERIVQVSRRRR